MSLNICRWRFGGGNRFALRNGWGRSGVFSHGDHVGHFVIESQLPAATECFVNGDQSLPDFSERAGQKDLLLDQILLDQGDAVEVCRTCLIQSDGDLHRLFCGRDAFCSPPTARSREAVASITVRRRLCKTAIRPVLLLRMLLCN